MVTIGAIPLGLAAKPVWEFIPQTPVKINLEHGSTKEIHYRVHNNSSRAKRLTLKAPVSRGMSQVGECYMEVHSDCILVLRFNGTDMHGDILGGPVLCQEDNSNQCYQPTARDSLLIHLVSPPPIVQYTVNPIAGVNGSISPSVVQVVNVGSNLIFSAIPDADFEVEQWLLDGNLVQTGNTSYQLNNIQSNHTVQVTFKQLPTDTYRLGGSISGLIGTVVLQNNDTDELSLSNNGLFQFSQKLAEGSVYEVTARNYPPNQICLIVNGGGIMPASDRLNVFVDCNDIVVGMIGSATPGGWDTDTLMSYNYDTSLYQAEIHLNVGEMKFRLNNDWAFNWGGAGCNGEIGSLSPEGTNIQVAQAGNYHIEFSLDQLFCSLTPV